MPWMRSGWRSSKKWLRRKTALAHDVNAGDQGRCCRNGQADVAFHVRLHALFIPSDAATTATLRYGIADLCAGAGAQQDETPFRQRAAAGTRFFDFRHVEGKEKSPDTANQTPPLGWRALRQGLASPTHIFRRVQADASAGQDDLKGRGVTGNLERLAAADGTEGAEHGVVLLFVAMECRGLRRTANVSCSGGHCCSKGRAKVVGE